MVSVIGILLCLSFSVNFCLYNSAEQCGSDTRESVCPSDKTRYLLYDVNPYEGFNLRRDVYIRLAVFLHNSVQTSAVKWKLVLPPWTNLPHWRSRKADSQSSRIPWGLFFNLTSLRSFVPVVEMYEFLEETNENPLDRVLVLQHYKDLFTGNFSWEEKWSVEECQRPPLNGNYLRAGGLISAKNVVTCVSFHGPASLLGDLLEHFTGRSVFLEHAEIVLHDYYGGEKYWECRRSMKFCEELIRIAAEYRNAYLSDDAVNEESRDSYLSVHLRRRDYVESRPKEVPSVEWAARQIKVKLEELDLKTVFVATDATSEEIEKLKNSLLPFKVVLYNPSLDILEKYKDGGVAIIEQIICSYARFFIGTYESTFSFRIQEERELLNFHPDTTFNRLCGTGKTSCKQPTRWLKVPAI